MIVFDNKPVDSLEDRKWLVTFAELGSYHCPLTKQLTLNWRKLLISKVRLFIWKLKPSVKNKQFILLINYLTKHKTHKCMNEHLKIFTLVDTKFVNNWKDIQTLIACLSTWQDLFLNVYQCSCQIYPGNFYLIFNNYKQIITS